MKHQPINMYNNYKSPVGHLQKKSNYRGLKLGTLENPQICEYQYCITSLLYLCAHKIIKGVQTYFCLNIQGFEGTRLFF
jgi:hypothetical protein